MTIRLSLAPVIAASGDSAIASVNGAAASVATDDPTTTVGEASSRVASPRPSSDTAAALATGNPASKVMSVATANDPGGNVTEDPLIELASLEFTVCAPVAFGSILATTTPSASL